MSLSRPSRPDDASCHVCLRIRRSGTCRGKDRRQAGGSVWGLDQGCIRRQCEATCSCRHAKVTRSNRKKRHVRWLLRSRFCAGYYQNTPRNYSIQLGVRGRPNESAKRLQLTSKLVRVHGYSLKQPGRYQLLRLKQYEYGEEGASG